MATMNAQPDSYLDPKNEKIVESLQQTWSALIRSGDTASRNYLHHLIERIEVDENEITIIPKEAVMMEG